MIGLQDQLANYKRPYVPASSEGAPAHPLANQSATTWQRVIDEQLIEWGRDPDQFVEEGLKPPTSKALEQACDFARHGRDRQIDPPLRAAPDGSGGIAFEWQIGCTILVTVEFNEHGKIEMLTFENSKLVLRMPIG